MNNGNFTPIYTYNSAHVYSVTGIALIDDSESISKFVTVSIDGEALLWDIRDSRPAKCTLNYLFFCWRSLFVVCVVYKECFEVWLHNVVCFLLNTALIKLPHELNTVSWNMSNEVAIGAEDGSVIVIDIRDSNQRDNRYLCQRGISKLVYNSL